MKNILETKNLERSFGGVRAIDNFSLNATYGEIIGLVGPNGSGKTTLVNILTGLLEKDSGKVILHGAERVKIKPWENPIYSATRTFQEIRLFEQISAIDNILVVLTERDPFKALFERHGELHQKRVEEILRFIGLYEKRNSLALHLSYGQRKLLEIARVMAMDSQLIFLDEPFAGLFPEIIKKIEEVIVKFKHEGKTVFLIEHNLGIIRRICDRVVVMDAGKILAEGIPEEILNKKEVIEAYIGE